jgi:hypothetical protein
MAIRMIRRGTFFDDSVRKLDNPALWARARKQTETPHNPRSVFGVNTNHAALQPLLDALINHLGGSR